ncbi:hypothetical protein T08_6716 [Trichinella sp. T8]|nr:hypothetical protein T08_6716 [Trichinella sp. T8]
MESMIINRSKTIRKVQQTYTGGCRLRFSRDMQKKVRTVPIWKDAAVNNLSIAHFRFELQWPFPML